MTMTDQTLMPGMAAGSPSLLAAASKAPALRPTDDVAKARASAEDFEAFFISQMLDTMFKGIRSDGPMGGGHAEEVFRGLLNQEYGKTIAHAGGFGIADMVMREMLHTQEVKPS